MPRGYPNSGERLKRDGEPTAAEIAAIEAEKAKIRGENAQNWANSRVKQVGTRPIGRKLLQSEKD